MLPRAGQDAHFDLVSADFAVRSASFGPQGYHHPLGPQGQRQGLLCGRQRLGQQVAPWGDSVQVSLQGAMAWRPAVCTQRHTARGRTTLP